MKRLISILFAFLLLSSFAACSKGDGEQANGTDILSDFTSIDLEGNEVDESILKGKKVTMVNIWATFCGPCIREMPDLQKLSEDYADKGFQVIGIVCDVYEKKDGFDQANLQLAKQITESTGVKYTSLLPTESLRKAKIASVTSVPETIFVDENGKQIGESYIGSKTYDVWAGIIDEIYAQLG